MPLFSIGHSNAGIEDFIALLRRNEISLLVDTRSKPYSRYNPHFSRDALKQSLNEHRIDYIFLGDRIGGKPEGEDFYFQSGKVDYGRVAEAPFYLTGLQQLIALAEDRRVAFMCAEADYKHCHRYWLITRSLVERGIDVRHILHSGETVASSATEFEPEQPSLF
ncbi:MAG TPA: DUF488 domain-containing protein [Blastocatellia bacterium]|nr:DUF488 domain-containing protein [Blastocatellia bacterium]HMV87665.1 DUF488 domain-containing protein [Blastocatellia bacterium]HMX24073.1 DUF488 domain-containing protein [Blastocatellia bacterium]HMY70941.1 DUF488 domain-containing protein [Blastocatellia bacterium]HMZ17481.1 DUF488 domain-containing protein [Blastocatellia bacterium]